MHKLAGFPSHSTGEIRRKQVEPEPELDNDARPKHLDAVAGAEWDRLSVQIRNVKMFTVVDRAAFEGYCVTYAKWREAEAMTLKTGGSVIPGKKRDAILNPWFVAAGRCLDQLRQMAVEFGFTPVSRSRIALKSTGKDKDDEFFDTDGKAETGKSKEK